ncbi:MAG: hypothetical protein SVU32_03865, partial [Candidatus Nanohaloarchaea archaeon]|nr:hypothetical protein [Candidatus Nanohaloarchaea archaeon]
EASEVSQDVMAHEHREGMCNHCGAEMDMVVAQPGEEDLDVYLYECDACGNEGHYFGGEETEDGAVTVWSEFTDRDSLTREVDVREGAKLTVYDLGDVPENPLEREPEQGRVYSMEVGNGWKTRPDGLLQRLLDRPVPMSQDVREVIERQMEDPNMGVLIEDPAGGSDVEDGDDHYVKVVDESQVEFQGIR